MPSEPEAPLFPSRGNRACTEAGYRRAITKACERARMPDGTAVPRWCPRQLRKNFATVARDAFTLDAAQVLLGHASADTTEIYAQANRQKAIEIITRIG